jgi:predicted DNA-binding transcriptional regulator AlpA
MNTSVEPGVYFIPDVCVRLGMSRRVLERLLRARAFPIAELPSLDRKHRWSIAAVEAFLSSQAPHNLKFRGKGRRKQRVPCSR